MKKLFIAVLFLIISAVLFGAEGQILPDRYCSKKVYISESKIQMNLLLEELSKQSGLKFIPGRENDWRVFEREISIFTGKEVSLENVLKAIATVTHLVWEKQDDETYILSYSPETDMMISNFANMLENKRKNDRENAYNNLFGDNTENSDDVREEDPFKYLMNDTGLSSSVSGTINSVPGLKENIISGSKRTISGSELSEEAINSIEETNRIFQEEIMSKFGGRRGRNRNNTNIFPEDMSRVSLEVNGDNFGGTNDIMLGNVIIKVDDRVVGGLPVLNTKNPLVKSVGRALIDMREDPNFNPKDFFSNLMGEVDLGEIGKSMNDELYRSLANPIPDYEFINQKIKLDEKPSSKAKSMELLAKATGMICACDEYANFLDNFPMNNIRTDGTVKDILTDINKTYGLTVLPENDAFCFYSLKWFEKIQKLMPLFYINKWENQYMTDQYISRETMGEMAKFTDNQIKYALTKKPALSKLNFQISLSLDLIRFLGTLNENAYALCGTVRGMKMEMLSDYSRNCFEKIRQFSGYKNNTEGRIKITVNRTDLNEIWNVGLYPNEESVNPVISSVTLNKYVPLTFGQAGTAK